MIPDKTDSTLTKKLQLDKNDIDNVFSMYGTIVDITIEHESCVAYVTFKDVIDAFIAKH